MTRALGCVSPIVAWPFAWALVCAPLFSAHAQTDAEEEARTFYYRGLEHFNLGEYEAAIDAFTRAYRAVQDPELLFNIAQSHRHLGGEAACRRAAELFTNYRRTLSPGEARPDVDALIAETEQCARPPVQAPQPPARPPIEDEDEPESSSSWPIWLTVGGAVVAATGGVLVWSISWADGCVPRCSPDLIDELRVRMWLGYGLVAAGSVAASVGLVAWVVQPSDSSGAQAWWTPTPSGVAVGGAF